MTNFLSILTLMLWAGVGAGAYAADPATGAPMRASSEPASGRAPQAGAQPAERVSGKVLETMDAAGYTYVRVDTGSAEVWAAGPRVKVAVGETVSFPQGMQMRDYHSKTLDRTFESIYFVDSMQVAGAGGAAASPQAWHGAAGASAPVDIDLAGIERAKGGKTVAEVYAEKDALSGKDVSVRGKVVKTNTAIMGKNWLHVRDGSEGPGGEADLTVTTQATANVGDTVVVSGRLGTKRDFGFGYNYEVLLEDATVTVE